MFKIKREINEKRGVVTWFTIVNQQTTPQPYEIEYCRTLDKGYAELICKLLNENLLKEKK